METLDQFIQRAKKKRFPTNAYVDEPGWDHLYVRYGPRIELGRRLEPTLDMANIQVLEDRRGQGIFTRLVTRLRHEHPDLHLFVENTHYRFGRHLEAMGFVDVTLEQYPALRSYLLEAGKNTERITNEAVASIREKMRGIE
jgi:GNAT superfamily N-acetyltransferase